MSVDLAAFHDGIWEAVGGGAPGAGFGLRLRFLLEQLPASGRVLDLGCGEAFFTEQLHDRGYQAVGADISALALERARSRRPDLELALLDERRPWPFAPASFDVVWASEVLPFVADTQAFLSAARTVLKPGGLLLATTPNLGRLELALCALLPRRRERRFDLRGPQLRFYTRPALAGLLADLAFERVEIRRRRQLLLARAVRGRF